MSMFYAGCHKHTDFHLKETSIESKREIIHLQEQNRALKAGLDRANKEIEDKITSFQGLQIELSRKEGTFQALLDTERLAKKEALDQVQETKTKIESLVTELAQEDYRKQEMAKRLAAAEAPSTEHEREVEVLKARITQLEAAEKRLADRAATISHRYENNDLVNFQSPCWSAMTAATSHRMTTRRHWLLG
jgi:chromosome segregation ATPase